MAADLPCLVICPASLILNWRREIAMWRPDAAASGQFTVVSYANKRLPLLEPRLYATIITDEAHWVKNPDAARTKVVCGHLARAFRAIALTGTLVPNRPIELWPLMYALRMTDLPYEPFARRYAGAYEDSRGELNVSGARNLPELRDLLRPHVLRYTKADVMPELPAKSWRVVALDLPLPDQEKDFDLDDLKKLPEPIAFEAVSDLLRLHGELKIPHIQSHVRDLFRAGVDKVVLFCYHREVIARLAAGLSLMGGGMGLGLRPHPVVVQGGMSAMAKQDAVDQFQEDDSCRLFIGQITTAGVGLNLTAAHHVVIAEGSWTPAVLDQAADRCHRFGQTNNVSVDLLTIHHSIDEHMLYRALEKAAVIEQIVPEVGQYDELEAPPPLRPGDVRAAELARLMF